MDQQENQNTPQEQVGTHCNLCGKKGQFQCGRCFEVAYCKPQHQKIDWPSHRTKCISMSDKIKNHNKQKYSVRAQIFDLLSDGRIYEAAQLANDLLQKQKKFCDTSSNFNNQLQYGASAVLLTRIWIYYKDFNKALDVLNLYLQSKMSFLKSVENLPIPVQGLGSDPEKKDQIEKKLNLISAVASVSHQLIRNSMDILQVLINHIEVIYGSNSLQLSNIYFYVANYLNFLNQPNKAFACFLKSAKLRGAKCATSYYNAGIICLEQKNYSTALDILLLALNNLSQTERTKHPQLQADLYEALGVTYKNLNIFNKTVLSLERSLCLREKTKDLTPQHEEKYRRLLALLSTIKSESQKVDSETKIYSLPRQKPAPIKSIELSLPNFKNINQADKGALNEEQANEDWIESFNEFKKRLNVISKVPQVPYVAKTKLLGKDKKEVIREQEQPSVVKSNNKLFEQKVHVNLEFIEMLTSSEMDFLNQLNRLISECREKSAIIDIFENSNLYQTLSREKLDLLYRLNTKLQRNPRDVSSRKITVEESFDQGSENYSREYALTKNTTPKKSKVVTPRLNLQNIKRNF